MSHSFLPLCTIFTLKREVYSFPSEYMSELSDLLVWRNRKLRNRAPKTALICDTSCKVQGSPKLSGLIIHQKDSEKSLKATALKLRVYYSKRTWNKVSQWKRQEEQSLAGSHLEGLMALTQQTSHWRALMLCLHDTFCQLGEVTGALVCRFGLGLYLTSTSDRPHTDH